jgi:glycosyltransferase involved in cell wall biosynthesis
MPDRARELADQLVRFVVDHVEQFEARHASRFELPTSFAGYPVGSDVRADLAYTLALLQDAGVDHIAGSNVDEAIRTVLFPIDGARTHTFFSYRVAETLARGGSFADNMLLADAPAATRQNLARACDSTEWIELLDEGLPANFATVLTRCELARRSLGLDVEPSVMADLLDRSRRLIEANPLGYIDDSEAGAGARYDIYTADVYLFTEPFADQLEPAWSHGARVVGDLVASVAMRNGAAMAWGRSLGALAVCHTIELGAMVLRRDLTDDRPGWLARTANAVGQLDRWTDGALVTAHRHRAQDGYRGLDRWLQTTFDCFGKLVWSALRLRDAGAVPGGADPFPARDELIRFETARSPAVWSFRSHATAFTYAFVGSAWADYLPGPRNPGLYEAPVDAPLPMFTPTVTADGTRYVAAGLPMSVEHRPGGVDAVWDAFPPLEPATGRPPLSARRRSTVTVERHVLHLHERLDFDAPPDAISLHVSETRHRPLRIDVHTDVDHRLAAIDTDGLAPFRSFWSELPLVHQVDLTPATHLDLTVSIRPLVRIATADPSHHYHRSLYDPLARDVLETNFGGHLLHRPDVAREHLERVDAFHLHWPEWFVDTPERAKVFVDLLAETGTTLIWTQHNLRPHRDVARADELYQQFASAARVVVHHSRWGRDIVCARYRFRDDAVHVVIPHGHFGDLIQTSGMSRSDIERDLGLRPGVTRIGIVGAPRREKDVQAFMDAFAATTRDDLELLVLSLDGERVPDDPRVVARPYEFVERAEYDRRMVAIDAVALPFDPDGQMLTTGVVGDVVGFGLPAIVSRWPYATEALGDAGIVYDDEDHLVRMLETVGPADLDRAARASRALRAELSWARLAPRFLDAVIDTGAIKS